MSTIGNGAPPLKLSAAIQWTKLRVLQREAEERGAAEEVRVASVVGGAPLSRAQTKHGEIQADLTTLRHQLDVLQKEQLLRMQEDVGHELGADGDELVERAAELGNRMEQVGGWVAQVVADAEILIRDARGMTTDQIAAASTMNHALADALLRAVVAPLRPWRIGPQPMPREREIPAAVMLRTAATSVARLPRRRPAVPQ
jgi:hypothetical protein